MLLTPHVFSGMTFASFVNNPIEGALMGLLSFFFVEFIPHWDPEGFNQKKARPLLIVDFFVAFGAYFIVLFLKGLDLSILLGGLFGALPYMFFFTAEIMSGNYKLMEKLHLFKLKAKHVDKTFWGIAIQVSICILAIAILFQNELNLRFPSLDKLQSEVILDSRPDFNS